VAMLVHSASALVWGARLAPILRSGEPWHTLYILQEFLFGTQPTYSWVPSLPASHRI
jgi:hypothetical protein